jgi:hypothetical protein
MLFQDVFDSDAFTAITLTQRINQLPWQDGTIMSRFPWTVTNSPTADIAIQKSAMGIGVIPAKERGEAGTEFGRTKKGILRFTPPHYPAGATINSTELKAALANADDPEDQMVSLQGLHDMYQAAFVRSFAQSWEYGAQGALDSMIRNPDGTEILDLGALYGDTAQQVTIDFTDPAADFITLLEESKTAAIHQLGGLPEPKDWVLLMFGPAAKFIRSNPKLAITKQRIDPAFLAADRVRSSSQYRFSDNVELLTYQGTSDPVTGAFPTAVEFGEEGGAMLIPVTEGLFDLTFTPAEGFNTINGPGQELYSEVPPEKITSKSYRLEAESNFVHTIRKPKALIKWVMPA